jgi:hypothetical protein
MIGNLNVGAFKQIAASGNVKSSQGAMLGIFVSAASATPTITVYDDPAAGTTTKIVDTFTPVAGTWYPIPVTFATGLNIVIAGTVSATVSYV